MSLIELARDQSNNPLEVVERMAAGNNWPFERAGEEEIALVVTGRWTTYQVSFTWMKDIEALRRAPGPGRDGMPSRQRGLEGPRPPRLAFPDRRASRTYSNLQGGAVKGVP